MGPYLLPLLYAVSGYLFAYLGYKRHTDLARVLGFKGLLQQPGAKEFVRPKVLDTSAIIDGRIGAFVEMGFIEGDIVVPSFVLEELQSIADSGEPSKRARGRRGLDTVHQLQHERGAREHSGEGLPFAWPRSTRSSSELAKEIKACIVTIDYNLNKVSQIQGVEVLNLNELGHAMKMAVIPGETLRVRVLREGKEEDQGVAYLGRRHHGGRRRRRKAGGRGRPGRGHFDPAESLRQDGLRQDGVVVERSENMDGRGSRLAIVVTAAGRGARFESRLPKQYVPLLGIPMLQRTLSALERLRAGGCHGRRGQPGRDWSTARPRSSGSGWTRWWP